MCLRDYSPTFRNSNYGIATAENSTEGPQKLKLELPHDPAASGYISKGNEISASKRYLHLHVDGSVIHSSLDMETA